MKRRKRIEPMFRDFILSILLGFLTGIITTQTAMLLLWKRHALTCRILNSKYHQRETPIGRFREFSSESTNKKLLFVGVMTTRKNLNSKATSIYRTWGRHVPGRLVFFVGTGDRVSSPLPVIELSDVSDDVFPPREKSFAMLRHIYSNYGNDYEWFMRADDDVYVQTDLLRQLLTSTDSGKDIYMGHPGTGTPDESGHLGLEDHPYCMGGPGVLFTGSTLRKVFGHLDACLNNTVTAHEDSELGRCIRRYVGLSCTSSKQFFNLFYQNYRDKSGLWTKSLTQRISQSLTFHPIKHTAYLYYLNIQLQGLALRQTLLKHARITSELRSLGLRINSTGHPETPATNCSVIPCDVDSREPWDCIYAYDVFSVHSTHIKESVIRRGDMFGLANAKHALYGYVKRVRMNRRLRLAKVAYQRVSSEAGLEHVIIIYDNDFRYYSFRTVRTFDPVQIREEPLVNSVDVKFSI